MYEVTDPVAAEQAAIAAENERLARQEERRRGRGSGAASGFARRKWRWLGVGGDEAIAAARGLLTEILESAQLPATQHATIERALEGSPDRETLLPAVHKGLSVLPADSVLLHLEELWATGVRWLTAAGADRCRVLCSTPGREPVTGRSHAVSGGPAFSLFVSAATRGAVPVPTRFLPELLPWAPLSVIDDLVDHGGLLPEDRPWAVRAAGEGTYLRARMVPATVTPADAEALGWQSFLRRRDFLAGGTPVRQEPEDVWDLLYDVLVAGDPSCLGALDSALPRAQQIELRDLRSGALNGQWKPDVLGDRGLWTLMHELWKPQEHVDPGRSEFHALVALNRAYGLLKAGDPESAARQALPFLPGAGRPRAIPAQLVPEAYTIAAYAAAVNGTLDQAEEYAVEAALSSDAAAQSNLELVRTWQRTTRNNRGPVTNPFLDVGLDHGSADWEPHCREIFRMCKGDQEGESRLNEAEDRIRTAQRHGSGFDEFFRVPLDRSRLRIPSAVSHRLVPPLEPLPRRTGPTSGTELEAIRARAALELLDDFRTTAPHLDRHGSHR
ncbi:hypothetical protein SSP531S_51550 [Streptomyces spongiicola]|uniref:Uncharacterized protein n=1 Tax=Streptomyces spongiicola TaxID=1690221 RepID=A0A388T6P2_9ACTN|nr:hypothetical protein [Streptomyces spongiicola]GBQ03680.1 hypothetical protein SSP531S_51550 [Streptomyces spongiicola]